MSLEASADTTTPTSRRGVPAGRLENTFANFEVLRNPKMLEAKKQCLAVAQGNARCALLVGGFGNGKTHLAVAALREYDGFRTGWFHKVPELLAKCRATFDDPERDIDGVLRPAMAPTLIVFDDLGAENGTDWATEQLFRVFDARYDNGCPTIITSNKNLTQIDGRIFDRFKAGLVICEGGSLR